MSTNYIDRIKDTGSTTHYIQEGVDTRIFRATCSTAADTAAKVATLDDTTNFSLTTGVRVAVTFQYGNSAATPTLNISSTGAKTIATPTAVATVTSGNGTTYNTWGPYETITFTYNGTYWIKGASSLGAYLGDKWVTQNYSTTDNSYPLLFSGTAGITSTSGRGSTTANLNNSLYVNPSIGALNATTMNATSIGATEGIFNKLIATTLDAKNATIDDLKATNATIVGLLDVQGQMQTNSWTNANIATIDGSFYICPTISSEANVTTSGTSQTSDNKFLYNGSTIVLTGTWTTTGSLYLNTTAANWTLYSKVMVTGEVLIGNEWTPIGTICGVLTGINTSSGTITIGSLSSNITVKNDGTINSLPAILSLVTSGTTYNARKLKVSLYEYNSTETSSGATNLIGIMMTTAGTHGFTYLDIYNGLNSKTSYTSTIDNTTKATEPVVRIGNLNGLPNIISGSTNDFTKPKGWGIYTTNGYFKGTLAATSGYIGSDTTYVQVLYDENSNAYLDTRVSQLQVLLGQAYNQDEIVDVIKIVDQQTDFIKLWTGYQIWKKPVNNVLYTVEEFENNESGTIEYYYDTNEYILDVEGNTHTSNWVSVPASELDNYLQIEIAGLGKALEFTEDSYHNQQSLVVNSGSNFLDRTNVTIDPQFINFKATTDNDRSLALLIGAKNNQDTYISASGTPDDNTVYFELKTDEEGEQFYHPVDSPSTTTGLYTNSVQTLSVDLSLNDRTIFDVSENYNYFLHTSKGFQIDNVGLFKYKKGLAIGIL